ncbi:MAG: hypothetical protein V1659_00980 [Candidatus Woesearchaeota archaeon]
MYPERPMRPGHKKLLKEAIIREYQLKNPLVMRKDSYNKFLTSLRKAAPFSIILGILASVIFVYWRGWSSFFYLVLSAVIWTTIIAAIISAIDRMQ